MTSLKKIIRREARPISPELFSLACHPVLKRIYANRDVTSLSALEKSLTGLLPYRSLSQIDCAVDRLVRALCAQERIVIFGDYDVDGATSTVLALRLLKAFGFQSIHYVVPDRLEHGYGLTPEMILQMKERFNPQLIMTVDNGIVGVEGVDLANELGVDVIITDHHLPNETLPRAVAVVNPKQLGDAFDSKHLAGVGVVFYLMMALRAKLRELHWFEQNEIPEPNLANYLDLVALGTIADVVQLDRNNRILVYQGIQRIRRKQCSPGIAALLRLANRDLTTVGSSDLSYAVAPRLNAAGRLEHMSVGIDCLLTDDPLEALKLAQQLNQLNEERRAIEKTMQREAMKFIEYQMDTKGRPLPFGLCLINEAWHLGVIGIVASRLKEHFQRPVVVFTLQERNADLLQGSARSIDGLDICQIFDDIAREHPALIKQQGGHAMAAGITIPKQSFAEFSLQFDERVKQFYEAGGLCYEHVSDGELSSEDMTLDFIQLIRDSGPWGRGFEEPVFDGKFKVLKQALVGEKHLKLVLLAGRQAIDAIAFNVDINEWPDHRCDYIEAVYRLEINEYQNRRSVQLIIEHMEKL